MTASLRPIPRLTMMALCAALCGFAALYGPVLRDLAINWSRDANYSHGFLIIPAVTWMVWRDRRALTHLQPHPATGGLLLVVSGLLVLLLGTLGAELFLTRVSMLVVLAGAVVFLLGWAHLRRLAFPLAFLALMVPLPAIIFNQAAFPLQILASQLGVFMLRLGDIPVLREGNIIRLSNATLEVAQACSGIRSLISLLTLGVLYGYVCEYGPARRITLAVLTIPIAIAANAMRVAGAGVVAEWFGPAAVEGFLHTFSGFLTFFSSILMLLALDRLVVALGRLSGRAASNPELVGS